MQGPGALCIMPQPYHSSYFSGVFQEYEKGSNSSYHALEMRGGWLKACLHGSIDRSCAGHGNSFDASISRLSFDSDEMEAKWLVLAVCHGFVRLGLNTDH